MASHLRPSIKRGCKLHSIQSSLYSVRDILVSVWRLSLFFSAYTRYIQHFVGRTFITLYSTLGTCLGLYTILVAVVDIQHLDTHCEYNHKKWLTSTNSFAADEKLSAKHFSVTLFLNGTLHQWGSVIGRNSKLTHASWQRSPCGHWLCAQMVGYCWIVDFMIDTKFLFQYHCSLRGNNKSGYRN